MDLIVGFKQLTQELEGLYAPGSLQVLDCKGKLPLTRLWHEGNRAFDRAEVALLKAARLKKVTASAELKNLNQ